MVIFLPPSRTMARVRCPRRAQGFDVTAGDAVTRLHPVPGGRPAPATEDLTYEYTVQLLSVLGSR